MFYLVFRIQIRWIRIQVRIQAFLNLDPDKDFIWQQFQLVLLKKNFCSKNAIYFSQTHKKDVQISEKSPALQRTPQTLNFFNFLFWGSFWLAWNWIPDSKSESGSLALNRIRIQSESGSGTLVLPDGNQCQEEGKDGSHIDVIVQASPHQLKHLRTQQLPSDPRSLIPDPNPDFKLTNVGESL
jgi:hypothetical protein